MKKKQNNPLAVLLLNTGQHVLIQHVTTCLSVQPFVRDFRVSLDISTKIPITAKLETVNSNPLEYLRVRL